MIAKDGGYSGNVNIPSKLTIDYEPYTVTGIGSGAFSDCSQLKEVIIPSTVIGIMENAFTNVPVGLNIYINKSK
ncbi:MAG: leucine-rich repeat domain-containing protein, partial [Paramuribaculum sp.]|nr:leucine-rich repeat domain-containing protein [Paramuribaculum sp.]